MNDRPRILLVEDDAAIREALAECLVAEGYTVDACAHGIEALERLQGGARPALLVLDLVMPFMSGAEVIARVRAEPALRDLPVVLMTAAIASSSDPVPPADTVLTKPFDLEELLAAVARHVRAAA